MLSSNINAHSAVYGRRNMAFYGFSDSHKIRVRISASATEIIKNDMDFFKFKSFSDIFNIIISNFKDNARASKTLYLQKKKNEILDALKGCQLDPLVQAQVCHALLYKEKLTLEKKLKEYMKKKPNDDYKIRYINNNNIDYLENECLEKTDELYNTPGAYLKCIIEEYCELPFSEREQIVKADIFSIIEDAIAAKYCLKIKAERQKGEILIFIVKPYRIMSGPLGGLNYLVCKSYPEGSFDSMRIASFAINRLDTPKKLKSEPARFSLKEETEIKERLQNIPPAYLTYDESEIHIKLTNNGKRRYQNLLFSRPIKDINKSTDDEYVFFCSLPQAYNYFFNFGDDVEILSPQELRDMFSVMYKKAYDIYKFPPLC